MIGRYDWAGGTEAMLRFGPDTGPVVVLALPLFEEANRTRAFAVTILRALAKRGVASVLPDLPGQGESTVALEEIRLGDWNSTISSVVETIGPGRSHLAAIRSGALLTHNAAARSRWLFAPQDGAAAVRDLLRTRHLADASQDDGPLDTPIEIAGNLISRRLLDDLGDAVPDRALPARVVRLESDPRDADLKIAGAPLWRWSEPGNDLVLTQILATDIAEWIAACER